MKKHYFYSFIVILTIVFNYACSNEQKFPEQNSQNELISLGMRLAKIHNECLENIFNDFNLSTRNAIELESEEIKDRIVMSINDYLSSINQAQTRNTDVNKVHLTDYNMTIEEIEKTLSEKEKYYIDKALSHDIQLDVLLNQVCADDMLEENNKQAVIGFITTLEASTEYWNEHLDEWYEYFGKPQSRASLETVAVADAWWAYQGLMSSGLNIIVGGGAAALASACTAIF